MSKKNYIIPFLLLLLFTGVLHAQDSLGYKIIVNELNPISEIKKDEVSKIFLKTVTKWEKSEHILPVDLTSDSPIRKIFSMEIHGRKVQSIKSFWQKQIFSGRGVPPTELDSEVKILAYVHQNQYAIGYISVKTSLSKFKVKVLKIKK